VRQSLPQMELQKVVEQCGILCLCSTDEPWGTVAQEFAAAGFPLLLSQQCGASDHFLSGNGFLCDGNNIEDIKSGLMSFIQSSDKALFQMSEISHQLGIQSNSDTWSKTLMSLV